MTEFVIRIADCNVGVRAVFEETKTYCTEYLTDGEPAFTVETTMEDICRERQLSDRERELEGLPSVNHSDQVLETTAVYRKIVEKLIDHDVLLFHGSVVAVDGVAYMFTAVSGTGKSTHTKLWRKLFGARAVMINDDKPLFKITQTGILVCGTPWDGKHHLNTNCMVPLKAICVLKRGEENEIQPLSARQALPVLLQQSYRPGNMLKYMDLIDAVTKDVKFYELHCNMEQEAAQVAYDGMQ